MDPSSQKTLENFSVELAAKLLNWFLQEQSKRWRENNFTRKRVTNRNK